MTELELSVTLTTPARVERRHVDAVRDALKRAGLPDPRELTQLRESVDPGPEVLWLVIGVAGYALKKLADPSLDEVGQRIRERIFAAPSVARKALPEEIGLEAWIEFTPDEELVARYWLPKDKDRDAAERSLIEHYRTHPDGDVDRYWYRGVGWLQAGEVHYRIGQYEDR